VKTGESWAVYGPSGCGKTLLKDIIMGKLPIYQHGPQHSLLKSTNCCVEISPQLERQLLEREKHDDDSEFIEGGFDPGRTTLELIEESAHPDFTDLESWAQRLRLEHKLDTSYKVLSNGETRKVLWLKAIAQNPKLILLDSPFEGLDQTTRQTLMECFNTHLPKATKIIFVQRQEDIPKAIDGILDLSEIGHPKKFSRESWWSNTITTDHPAFVLPEELKTSKQNKACTPLIRFKNLDIAYGENVVFKDFNWEMNPGENWLFTGPNGAGKTTLLQLIHADHPQSYGQDIKLFGYQRGQGESIWDIKSHIGFVSADFQRHYPLSLTGTAMVVSGFFDSMGVYQKPSPHQLQLTKLWLESLQIEHLAQKYLRLMSWGEIRILMIARALVKKPSLLILDEPCQGLDDQQKKLVLDLIENCCRSFEINIILVSHHPDEKLECLTHHLEWKGDPNTGYRHLAHTLT
jgi:molybdate transport system ATP-binding protein